MNLHKKSSRLGNLLLNSRGIWPAWPLRWYDNPNAVWRAREDRRVERAQSRNELVSSNLYVPRGDWPYRFAGAEKPCKSTKS